jgi:hypothetical protein
MTGLRGISATDYEFLRPTAGDPGSSAWEKASAASQGVPGLDAFPILNSDDSLRLLSGEEALTRWVSTSLHWTSSSPAPGSRCPASGEVVKNGKLPVVLTDRRLAVIVPQEYINYEGIPGRGATVVPTMSDRLKMRAVRRVGGKIAPRLVDELLGDMAPRAGHLPLDSIATVAADDNGKSLAIGFEIVDISPSSVASVQLGVRDGNAAVLAQSIAEAIRDRWASVGLAGPMLELVRTASWQRAGVVVSYIAPLHRSVGSGTVTVVDGSRPSFPAPADLMPVPDHGARG